MQTSRFYSQEEHLAHLRAVGLVLDERARQIGIHGHTALGDDLYGLEELAAAAAFFLLPTHLDPSVRLDGPLGDPVTQSLRELVADAAWVGIERDGAAEHEFHAAPSKLPARIRTLVVGIALGLAELERVLRFQSVVKGRA
ncbi:hypothetical protein KR767_04215 [Luteibacter anthropi]|uniref:hypothetical protein n=1 Tax=Luteibacter anthropi TaxID=564369 RepID=UPI00203303C6|nr:hypothetical protein [Luteibacter anthropi]URX63282.1 hypothetical protein KR767_04215 [Luteibacter anthropi]